MNRRVLVIQRTIPQYRRRFFELLRAYLAESRVDFSLVHGRPEPEDEAKHDVVHLDWAAQCRTAVIPIGRRNLYWQACLSSVCGADLVIVEQASRLLVNYPLLLGNEASLLKLAIWGHGRTPKATPPSRLGESAKAFVSRRAHWWFAYNELGGRYVADLGYPAERITVVQNAIDTRALEAASVALKDAELVAVRNRLKLRGENICLFVGAMYREKRLPFLVAACEMIKQRVPDFEMLFIGDGPDRTAVREAVRRNPWMRDLGPRFDEAKVPYYRLAKLSLMPGGVGLGVLDSFALRVPLVTTAVSYQGPEIDYLCNGVNGVIVNEADSPVAFSERVVSLLRDDRARDRLREGCRRSAASYSVEDMASRFSGGIIEALAAHRIPRRRQSGQLHRTASI